MDLTHRLRRVAAGAFAAILSPACATILAGGPDHIPVNSEPPGAVGELDGDAVGETPTIVIFERTCDGVLTLRKTGYATVRVDRDKVVNGWVFANIVLGGVIGVAVDLITNNQGLYSEDAVLVRMTPGATAMQ